MDMDIYDDMFSVVVHDPLSSCELGKIKIVENPTGHNIYEKYFVDINRQLGRGSFGVVHVCVDWASGHRFACKTVCKADLIGGAATENLKNEVAVMRCLTNKDDDGRHRPGYVISLKDVYEDDVAVHIVMDLCRGRTLFDVMMKRMPCHLVFREDEAAMILRTIVRIIQMLHEKGIIHGDVKPENFIYENKRDDHATLKIIDFGIARFFKPGEKFNAVKGTRSYMAPELIRGDYGPEIDIWSAGIILYALLTLQFPFTGGDLDEMGEAINRNELGSESNNWPNVSHNAKDLILKMLNTDPIKRITTYEILKHPWLQMYTEGN